MTRGKSSSQKARRPSSAQVIFLALTIVILLSFVLSLFIKV